jgi:hypothetical protein
MSGVGWVNCTYELAEGNDTLECLGNEYFDEGRDEPLSVAMWMDVAICFFLVCFAGLMSGLTLGLLSLDPYALKESRLFLSCCESLPFFFFFFFFFFCPWVLSCGSHCLFVSFTFSMTLRIMAASTDPDDAIRAKRARRILPIVR